MIKNIIAKLSKVLSKKKTIKVSNNIVNNETAADNEEQISMFKAENIDNNGEANTNETTDDQQCVGANKPSKLRFAIGIVVDILIILILAKFCPVVLFIILGLIFVGIIIKAILCIKIISEFGNIYTQS